MSRSAAGMAGAMGGGRLTDLRNRILFLLGALIVFRIGAHIPIPGVNAIALSEMFKGTQNSIIGMFNMFGGGALKRMSLFALGVMPYISASIIVQLLTSVVPSLEELKKEGQSGQHKITQYTRYGTVVLAIVQAGAIAVGLESQPGGHHVVTTPGVGFIITTVVTLVTGTMFLMWLGEQMTERGVGNGISMLIFAGIVSGLPNAVALTLDLAERGTFQPLFVLLLFIIAVGVTAFVVFVERGQRRITVNYAKRQQGRRMIGGHSSHLPLKVNMSGVIPPIFASSIILFPVTAANWFGQNPNMAWLRNIATTISPGQPLYAVLYASAIVFFCFFYTALVFNPKETADNLKKSGAFVPGIRPGEQTANYIDKVMSRLTLGGAVYIVLVCLLPEFLYVKWNVPFYFGGTSLLIVVVVCMDFMAQVQTLIMSRQYESLLKKANLSGMTLPR
jgi:preprotein translocase subunit SecY